MEIEDEDQINIHQKVAEDYFKSWAKDNPPTKKAGYKLSNMREGFLAGYKFGVSAFDMNTGRPLENYDGELDPHKVGEDYAEAHKAGYKSGLDGYDGKMMPF